MYTNFLGLTLYRCSKHLISDLCLVSCHQYSVYVVWYSIQNIDNFRFTCGDQCGHVSEQCCGHAIGADHRLRLSDADGPGARQHARSEHFGHSRGDEGIGHANAVRYSEYRNPNICGDTRVGSAPTSDHSCCDREDWTISTTRTTQKWSNSEAFSQEKFTWSSLFNPNGLRFEIF